MTTHEGSGTIGIATTLASGGSQMHAAVGVIPAALALTGNIVAAPRVVSAAALLSTVVRVHFDQSMTSDSRLEDKANYTLTPAAGGADSYVQGVIPENSTDPTYVDLYVNELTDGIAYQVDVATGAGSPVALTGIALNALVNVASFTGLGIAPTIAGLQAISANLVDVIFSENMLDNDAIRDFTKYTFDNGLTVSAVMSVDGNTVRLVTSDQTPGLVYTLTIS